MQTNESAVAMAQMKFFLKVTDVRAQAVTFFQTLLRSKQGELKGNQSAKSDEMALKTFSESKLKEITEGFKTLQKEVLDRIKELEKDYCRVSLDLSDESDEPITPPAKENKVTFRTPQVFDLEKKGATNSRIKTQCLPEKRTRGSQMNRTQSVKRCLFKN